MTRNISNIYQFFYRNILEYFRDLKSLYGSNQAQDIILINNKDILVGEKPVYISEWFKKSIVSIRDLLNDDGNFLTFQEFVWVIAWGRVK